MYQGPNPQRKQVPNAACRYEMSRADLPVHCPLPEMSLWNSHPQVYIPLRQVGDQAYCPYCSAEYRLVEAPRSGT